jgi:hypothetical protein
LAYSETIELLQTDSNAFRNLTGVSRHLTDAGRTLTGVLRTPRNTFGDLKNTLGGLRNILRILTRISKDLVDIFRNLDIPIDIYHNILNLILACRDLKYILPEIKDNMLIDTHF